MKKMDKSGKKMAGGLTVFLIVILAAVAVLAALKYVPGLKEMVGITTLPYAAGGAGTAAIGAGTAAGPTTTDVVNIVSFDAMSPGTGVSPGYQCKINGKGNYATFTSGTTKAYPGNTLDCVANYTVGGVYYHTSQFNCVVDSSFRCDNPMEKNATSFAIRTFNQDGNVMNSGANGAENISAITSGGSANLPIYFDGIDKQSPGDLVCLFEADAAKVDKIVLSGAGASYVGTSKPASYTTSDVANGVWLYEVPAVKGAIVVQGTVGITLKSGQTLQSEIVYVTCRSKEKFIDSVFGDVRYAIEDSAGTSQSKFQIVKTYYTDYS